LIDEIKQRHITVNIWEFVGIQIEPPNMFCITLLIKISDYSIEIGSFIYNIEVLAFKQVGQLCPGFFFCRINRIIRAAVVNDKNMGTSLRKRMFYR